MCGLSKQESTQPLAASNPKRDTYGKPCRRRHRDANDAKSPHMRNGGGDGGMKRADVRAAVERAEVRVALVVAL